jgi:hypothetical protein
VHRTASRPQALSSKDGAAGLDSTLCVPLWAGPSHVMKLGSIGIANTFDQLVPPRMIKFGGKRGELCRRLGDEVDQAAW